MQNESTNPYRTLFPKVEKSNETENENKPPLKSRFNDDINHSEEIPSLENEVQKPDKQSKKGRFNDENPFYQARQTYGDESDDPRVKIKKETKVKREKEEKVKKEYPSSFGWFLTLFLTIIPIVGLVHIFHLAFNKTHMKAKATFARGVLILLGFILVCFIGLLIGFGGFQNLKEAFSNLIQKIRDFI